MGGRFFRSILDNIGELKGNEPFIDILNKLEKFGVVQFLRMISPVENVPPVHEWEYFREIRNELTHDYPDDIGQRIAVTNAALTCVVRLYEIYSEAKKYITNKLLANMQGVDLKSHKMPKLPTHKMLKRLYLQKVSTTAPGDEF